MKDRHVAPTPANMALWTWRGVTTFAVTAALALSVFAAIVANPVEEGHDLVAGVIVDDSGRCHGGWSPQDNSTADIFDYSCTRTIEGKDYVVWLGPNYQCNRWVELQTGAEGIGCEDVPRW